MSTNHKTAINNFANAQSPKSPKAILLIKPKKILTLFDALETFDEMTFDSIQNL